MLKHVPNAISTIRLLATPLMAWLVYTRQEDIFAWMLLGAGLSDLFDGWLARKLEVTSNLGALLDSAADLLLMIVTLFAVGYLHSYVFSHHGNILILFIVTWVCVHGAAFYRYGKLASFHTLLARVAIGLFGIFALLLFFFEFIPELWYFAGILGVLAGIENLVMVFLIPTWQPNVRGGLYTLLRNRNKAQG